MNIFFLMQAAFVLDKTPDIEIRQFKDSEFGNITDIVRMKNGNFVVIDNGFLHVYFFDSKGNPISVAGREGKGPGEFLLIEKLGECKEGVFSVFDPNNARVTDFSTDGKILNSQISDNVFSNLPYDAVCKTAGQTLVVNPPDNFFTPKLIEGAYRDSATVHVQTNKENRVKLGRFLGDERWLWLIRKDRPTGAPRPKGKRLLTALGDNIFVSTSDSFYIEVYNLLGKKTGAFRYKTPLKRITERDRQKFIEEEAEDRHISISLSQRMIGTALPEFLPPFEKFLANKDKIWIQLSRNGTDTELQWLEFDSSGKLLGSLTVPTNFQVFQFSDSSVLGKWTDSNLADSVRYYQLKIKL